MKRKVVILVKNVKDGSVIADLDVMYVDNMEQAIATAERYYSKCLHHVVVGVYFVDSVHINMSI